MLKETQMSMVKTQSDFFRKLTYKEKQRYLDVIKENEDVALPVQCHLDVLIGCNGNKAVIKNCFNTAVNYTDIPICLNQYCPKCAVALATVLGFDMNTMRMTRFITKTSSGLGNILSTPYAINDDPTFETHMYIDENGRLTSKLSDEKMTKILAEHRTYWRAKLGPRMPEMQRNKAEMALIIVDTADKLVDVIGKTKALYLDEIEKSIKKINVNVEGVTAEARKQIEEATASLYKSQVKVQKTRALLESLAKTTIDRVDSMLHYLSKVKDDWSAEKISKFMKYQAKEMTSLVERSVALIKEADELYTTTQLDLSDIQAKLESFNQFMVNLRNKNSAAYKDRVETIRLEVYLPCCIPCPLCCAVCAAVLETEIGKWESALESLQNSIKNNQAAVTKLTNEAKETIERLGQEVVSLIDWGDALNRMAQVDWTFPEVEIFGFADVRPDLVKKLDSLKKAAENYLKINSD